MAHSSIGIFASAVRGPLAGLALGVTMAAIGLLAGGGPSQRRECRPKPGRSTAILELNAGGLAATHAAHRARPPTPTAESQTEIATDKYPGMV